MKSTRAVMVSCAVLLSLSVFACTEADTPPIAPGRLPPMAEFLISAGDSTYWVRSGAEGLRVRSAPLLLTRADGAFHELRITEQTVDYLDAEFVLEQLYGYPLNRRDSTLLFDDGSVATAHAEWQKEHPDEVPIDIADADAPEPASSATDYLEVIDVHGRWVSWAFALDVDIDGAVGHTHRRRRGVVDITSGAVATLGSLMSPSEALRIEERGRASLDTTLEVIRNASDDRAARARETLHTFTFDVTAFSITNGVRDPSITFHIAGTGVDGEALELLLPPIVLDSTPSWWADVQPTLPIWSDDSLRVRWSHNGYTVIGDVDSARTQLALSLMSDAANARPWAIAVVPMPTYQFVALDVPPTSDVVRASLRSAFDRASGDTPYASRAKQEAITAMSRTALVQQARPVFAAASRTISRTTSHIALCTVPPVPPHMLYHTPTRWLVRFPPPWSTLR